MTQPKRWITDAEVNNEKLEKVLLECLDRAYQQYHEAVCWEDDSKFASNMYKACAFVICVGHRENYLYLERMT